MTRMVQELRSFAAEVDTRKANNVADDVAQMLVDLGITHAFGIIGGSCTPLVYSLREAGITVVQSRHEAGAVFQAVEGYFATGVPAACFATTGPGLTNTLTGIGAARWDQAKVLLLSGITSASLRGRGAVQETSSYTLPHDVFFAPGPFFNFAATLSDPVELDEIRMRLRTGLAKRGGFVAHVAIPLAVQSSPSTRSPRFTQRASVATPSCSLDTARQAAELLGDGPFVIWVGAGALEAAKEIRQFAEFTGASVMCSPRAKGIFPEDHPQFLGVTGAGGHSVVNTYMRESRPSHVLVLGTRMSEVTSSFDDDFVPSECFVHVDLDASVFGAAFPRANTFGVQSDCRSFLQMILPLMSERSSRSSADPRRKALAEGMPSRSVEYRTEGPVRPQALMAAIQNVVIDNSDALVMTEAGNSFAWGNHHLRFNEPGRYRTSSAWGSMGHMVAGVVGAAAMRRRKAVAIVGDGAMMMNNELNTAVKIGAPAVWIVLNDAKYGIVDQGMRAWNLEPVETDLPHADFVEFARSMGANGAYVRTEAELEAVLQLAMQATGPFVVDVDIDTNEVSPIVRQRMESLRRQGNPMKAIL